jgi:hypothetical protein
VCGQRVLWAAVQCSCVLFAWVMLGWAALVGSRDARERIARVEAGRRSAQRKALRHWALFCCEKVVFVGFALEGGSRAEHVTNTENKYKRDVTRYHTLAHARAAVVAVHALCVALCKLNIT